MTKIRSTLAAIKNNAFAMALLGALIGYIVFQLAFHHPVKLNDPGPAPAPPEAPAMIDVNDS